MWAKTVKVKETVREGTLSTTWENYEYTDFSIALNWLRYYNVQYCNEIFFCGVRNWSLKNVHMVTEEHNLLILKSYTTSRLHDVSDHQWSCHKTSKTAHITIAIDGVPVNQSCRSDVHSVSQFASGLFLHIDRMNFLFWFVELHWALPCDIFYISQNVTI